MKKKKANEKKLENCRAVTLCAYRTYIYKRLYTSTFHGMVLVVFDACEVGDTPLRFMLHGNSEFSHPKAPYTLRLLSGGVELRVTRALQYQTLTNYTCDLHAGGTALVPFDQTIQTRSVTDDTTTMTVYFNDRVVFSQPQPSMVVFLLCGDKSVEYTATLLNGLNNIRPLFKAQGFGVLENYRFSKHGSNVPEKSRKFPRNIETFASMFGDATWGELYAYRK